MFKFRRNREFLYMLLLGCFFASALWYSYKRKVGAVASFDLNWNSFNDIKHLNLTGDNKKDNEIHDKQISTESPKLEEKIDEVGGNLEVEDVELVEEPEADKENFISRKKPVILMWSKYYRLHGDTLMKSIFSGKRWNPGCCSSVEVTLDRGRLEEATAIVIYHYFENLDLKDLPGKRSPEQLWVLFSKESPTHSNDLGDFDNLFNLTMSYRHDSDIWNPYGVTKELEKPLKPEDTIMFGNLTLDELISGKTKLISGVISHCPTYSRREKAAKKILQNGQVKVDIYGSCGPLHICPRHARVEKGECNPNEIWTKISKEYKFYFSAENSICVDYITEKFWRPLEIGVVPVVYGGGNYTRDAPPGSFIDSRDFRSPQDLGNYLKKLDQEPDEYRKFFEWRRKYQVYKTDAWHGWCDLCQYIQKYSEHKVESVIKIYDKLGRWWAFHPNNKTEKACSKPFWKL